MVNKTDGVYALGPGGGGGAGGGREADTNQIITQIYNELFTRHMMRVEGAELARRGRGG